MCFIQTSTQIVPEMIGYKVVIKLENDYFNVFTVNLEDTEDKIPVRVCSTCDILLKGLSTFGPGYSFFESLKAANWLARVLSYRSCYKYEVLKIKAIRQHRFDFLQGDAGTRLPVDAFYPDLSLVIEFMEKQHSESVNFFDRKETVSGISRGEQRKKYDALRKKLIPANGLKILIFDYSEFEHTGRKKLVRIRERDLSVVQDKLNYNGF